MHYPNLATLAAACTEVRVTVGSAAAAFRDYAAIREREDLAGLALTDQARARLLERLDACRRLRDAAEVVDAEVARLHASWVGVPLTPDLEPEVMEAARLYREMGEAIDELEDVRDEDAADWWKR